MSAEFSEHCEGDFGLPRLRGRASASPCPCWSLDGKQRILQYSEFLANAPGEAVVAGIRAPQELTLKAHKSHGSDLPSLEEVMPKTFKELFSVRSQLETHYNSHFKATFKLHRVQRRFPDCRRFERCGKECDGRWRLCSSTLMKR